MTVERTPPTQEQLVAATMLEEVRGLVERAAELAEKANAYQYTSVARMLRSTLGRIDASIKRCREGDYVVAPTGSPRAPMPGEPGYATRTAFGDWTGD